MIKSTAMSKDIKTPAIINDEEKQFKGYSIDELKYQRAFILLQREFTQAKLAEIMQRFTNKNSSIYNHNKSKKQSPFGVGNILGRIVKGLDYLDYAVLGLSVFSTGKKIFSVFRRRK